eukprot:Skav226974  [mRNA]  locus=scaffold51:413605:414687:- [translate_table: standard]
MGRCRDSRGNIKHGSLRKDGYYEVSIKGKRFLLHRVLLLLFSGPPPNATAWQVNHLDGNWSNNQLENLEWATRSENMEHTYKSLGRQDSKHSQSKPVSVDGTDYPSISEAARMRGETFNTLRMRCHRNAIIDGCEYRFCPCDDGNLPGEEWKHMINPRTGKEVPGRMVSSHGRIRSKSLIVSFGCQRKDGYLVTKIAPSESSRIRVERVHRLVAYAFLGPPPTLEHTQINHKDGSRSNNSLENLEWVTPAQNAWHRCANQKGPLSNWKPVLSRACGSHGKWRQHLSGRKAAKTLGLDRRSVSLCARSRRKQAGGFEFRFVEAEENQNEDLPGEVWRDVDLELLLRDQEPRRRKSPKKKSR